MRYSRIIANEKVLISLHLNSKSECLLLQLCFIFYGEIYRIQFASIKICFQDNDLFASFKVIHITFGQQLID